MSPVLQIPWFWGSLPWRFCPMHAIYGLVVPQEPGNRAPPSVQRVSHSEAKREYSWRIQEILLCNLCSWALQCQEGHIPSEHQQQQKRDVLTEVAKVLCWWSCQTQVAITELIRSIASSRLFGGAMRLMGLLHCHTGMAVFDYVIVCFDLVVQKRQKGLQWQGWEFWHIRGMG